MLSRHSELFVSRVFGTVQISVSIVWAERVASRDLSCDARPSPDEYTAAVEYKRPGAQSVLLVEVIKKKKIKNIENKN